MRGGFSGEGAFEGEGGVFGLTDQDEGLAEIVGGQGIILAGFLGLGEGSDGGGILAALKFEESQNEPGGAVIGVFVEAVAIRFDEGVERAAFDVIAVDAVQGRAAAGIFLEQGEECSIPRCSRASSAAAGSAALSVWAFAFGAWNPGRRRKTVLPRSKERAELE